MLSFITSFFCFVGKFYLVDAGFPNRPEFISPFRGTRYHLADYEGATQAPTNEVENFNYRHAQLHSVIERTFGIIKNRFAILKGCMPFPYITQAKIVVACFMLHNFIRQEKSDDMIEDLVDVTRILNQSSEHEIGAQQQAIEDFREESTQMRKTIADNMRANIMRAMWEARR
jgi:hypothetical protein